MPDAVVIVAVAEIPEQTARDSYLAYERAVLPLIGEHGGELQRRLRSADGLTEIHLLGFPSDAAFERYRDDPRRAEHCDLLERSGARTRVFALADAPIEDLLDFS